MKPPLTLCRIGESDDAELRAMAYQYWEDLMPHAAIIRDPERRTAYYAEHFRLDDALSVHWWAITGHTRVGFAKVDLWENHDGSGATIRDFFIDREHRRHGFGRAFAQAMIDELAAHGIHRIDLNVRVDNPAALAFWQSVGFDLSLYQLRRYLSTPDQMSSRVRSADQLCRQVGISHGYVRHAITRQAIRRELGCRWEDEVGKK